MVARLPTDASELELCETGRRGSLFGRLDSEDAYEFWLAAGVRAAEGNPIVVRGVGTDRRSLYALAHVLGVAVYRSERLGYCDSFEVEPFTESLSETTDAGGFHSDFSTQALPPSLAVLQCVRPDPRHPHYGRNQVVGVDAALTHVALAFGDDVAQRLRRAVIPHRFGTAVRQLPLLDVDASGDTIVRFHSKLVAADLLEPIHFEGNFALYKLLEVAAAELAADVALDAGDILIFSNHRCLHRRGESSVAFDRVTRSWKGRIINSVRYLGDPG